eukprot:3468168-Amphidinium_carterae.1
MQIISGNPADVYILLLEVRLYPTYPLTRKKGLLNPGLQVSVAPLGLAASSLEGLHSFDSTFAVTDHFM